MSDRATRWEAMQRHWMLACLPMAITIGAMLLSLASSISLALAAVWLQFVVYLIHEFEEHVFPGGFKDFVNEQLAVPALRKRFPDATIPAHDFPLDDRAVFWINISFIWIAFPVFAVLAGTVDIRFGLLLPWFGMVNASLHILMGIARRAYNPGLIVSVVLNIPTGIWTLGVLADAGVTMRDQALFAAIAVLGHAGLIAGLLPRIRRIVRA